MAQLLTSGAEYRPTYDGRIGPWRDASGRFNGIMKETGARDNVYAFRSPAGGPLSGTWGSNSEGNGTTNFAIVCVDTQLVGTTLHVAFMAQSITAAQNWILRYATYTLGTTPAWSIGELVDDYSTSGTLSTETYTPVPTCRIDVRSDGDVLIAYQGGLETVKGTDRNRVKYARREGGSWTANIALDAGGAIDYDHPRAGEMTGTDNFYIMFCNRGDAQTEGTASSSRDKRYIDSSNSINTAGGTTNYGPSDAVAIDSNDIVVIERDSSTGQIELDEVDATPSTVTNRSSGLFNILSGWGSAGCDWDGSKLHIIARKDDTTDSRRYATWVRTNTWTDVQEEEATETSNYGYSVVYNGADGKLGYFFADAATGGDCYYEEITLTTYSDLVAAPAGAAAGTGAGKPITTLSPAPAGAGTGTGAGTAFATLLPAYLGIASNTGEGSTPQDLIVAPVGIATGTGTGKDIFVLNTLGGANFLEFTGTSVAPWVGDVLSAAPAGAATNTGAGQGYDTLAVAPAGIATNTGTGKGFETLSPAFAGAGTGTGAGTAFELLVAAFSALATGTATGLALEILTAAFAGAASNTGTGSSGVTYEDLIAAFAASAANTGAGQPFTTVVPAFAGAATGSGVGILCILVSMAAAASNTGAGKGLEALTAAFAGAGTGTAAGTALETLIAAFSGAGTGSGAATALETLSIAFNGIATNIGWEDLGYEELIIQALGLATTAPAYGTVYKVLAPHFRGIAKNHTPAELLIQLLGAGTGTASGLSLVNLSSVLFSGAATGAGAGAPIATLVPAFAGSAAGSAAALGYTLIVPVFNGAASVLGGGGDIGVLTIDFNGRAKVWGLCTAPTPIVDFVAKAYGHEFVAKAFRSAFFSNELK